MAEERKIKQRLALLPCRVLIQNRYWQENKAVVIDGGRIQAIVSSRRLPKSLRVIELPETALLPAWVNSHSHLEYTDASFAKPKKPGFVEWLEALVAWKNQRTPQDIRKSLERGVQLCLAHGVGALADHYSGRELPKALLQSPLKGIVFCEVLGLNPAHASGILQAAISLRKGFRSDALRFGLALHAPYSMSAQLLQTALSFAREEKIPLSMHVAESREEQDLFLRGKGPLADWLQKKSGMSWHTQGGESVYSYLKRHGVWEQHLQAVHMNMLMAAEWKKLPAHVAVAICPHSHAYFRHARFALSAARAKGRFIGIGTDSMASNQDLNMFSELRMFKKANPSISFPALWDMATRQGARALGLHRSGQITPGFSADILGLPVSHRSRPFEEALAQQGPVSFLMINGRLAYGAFNC